MRAICEPFPAATISKAMPWRSKSRGYTPPQVWCVLSGRQPLVGRDSMSIRAGSSQAGRRHEEAKCPNQQRHRRPSREVRHDTTQTPARGQRPAGAGPDLRAGGVVRDQGGRIAAQGVDSPPVVRRGPRRGALAAAAAAASALSGGHGLPGAVADGSRNGPAVIVFQYDWVGSPRLDALLHELGASLAVTRGQRNQCDGFAITEFGAAQSVDTLRCLIRQMSPSGTRVSR